MIVRSLYDDRKKFLNTHHRLKYFLHHFNSKGGTDKGAATLAITTLSIVTLRKLIANATLSRTALSIMTFDVYA
jgi:hypothetical protein